MRALVTSSFKALAATSVLLLPVHGIAQAAPMCVPDAVARAEAVCSEAEIQAAHPAIDTSRVYDEQLLFAAQSHLAAARIPEARAALREAAARFPIVADHFALMEGEIALAAGAPLEARVLFEAALESPSSFVKLRARIGRVRAMLQARDREASSAMRALLAEYPELPDAEQLRLAEARALEDEGRLDDAARLYRAIDLEQPGSYAAATARERMTALAARDVVVPPYTAEERVARATALVASGPMEDARREVAALVAAVDEGYDKRAVYRLAMRIARVEGRFEDAQTYDDLARAEARREPARGRRRGAQAQAAEDVAPDPESSETAEETAALTAADAEAMSVARVALRRLTRGRPIRSVPAEVLAEATGLASELGLDDTVRAAVDRAIDGNLPPEVRFAVAMAASGTSADDLVLRLLGSLRDQPEDLGAGARYHHARTLERLGRFDDAAAAFERLATSNRSGSYYAVWARQRLVEVRAALARQQAAGQLASAGAGDAGAPNVEGGLDGGTPIVRERPSLGDAGVHELTSRGVQLVTYDGNAPAQPVQADYRAIADRLHPVAVAHVSDFPWLARAEALLRLRAADRAESELYEALVAWRRATGRPIGRTGIEAVSRGETLARVVRRPAPRARGRHAARSTRRARPARRAAAPRRSGGLDESERNIVADVAAALGDYGTAIAIGTNRDPDERPRAYAEEVEASARRYGIDPNLIYAVMRVESVYQARVVSYAGAIGLMQIMPRTGQLIARQLGRAGFTTADLLDPRTNIDFAAWYLASLLERFDGRVPLAIASYNGGPHNVRVWIESHGARMPLDAFLERIPFEQTHRYVRRVLVHYAAYREQAGLDMVPLETSLPGDRVDRVAF